MIRSKRQIGNKRQIGSKKQIRNKSQVKVKRQIKNIIQATDAYIRMFDIPFDIRFDIITLVGENEDFQIEHIEDAFLPPLNCR